jgi:hypothetical protein
MEKPDTAIRVMQRRIKDATVIMLFNESAHPVKNSLSLQVATRVQRWDAETGHIDTLAGKIGNIPVDLKPYQTAFYLVMQ